MSKHDKIDNFLVAQRPTDRQYLRVTSFQGTRSVAFVKHPADATRVALPDPTVSIQSARFYFENANEVRQAADTCKMVRCQLRTLATVEDGLNPPVAAAGQATSPDKSS